MNISLKTLLKDPLFENAELLAGASGQFREIERVSVFDAPFGPDVVEKGIILPGDLFITCLLRIEDAATLIGMVEILGAVGSCGICLVSDEDSPLVTPDVLAACDECSVPFVHLRSDLSYAYVMDIVNRYITAENMHIMRRLKLDKIVNGRCSARECVGLLRSMNDNMHDWVQVVSICAPFKSTFLEREWDAQCVASPDSVFVKSQGHVTLILSADDEVRMPRVVAEALRLVEAHFEPGAVGVSRCMRIEGIPRALQESEAAMQTGRLPGRGVEFYNPLSSLQLLMPLRNSLELQGYYDTFCERLTSQLSPEAGRDLMETVRQFVYCDGNYARCAQALCQHENTVRYRINKVRALLGLEGSVIEFHQVISTVVQIERVLGIEAR